MLVSVFMLIPEYKTQISKMAADFKNEYYFMNVNLFTL